MPEARPAQTRHRAIRQLLLQKLGERDCQCFTDDHVQYLVQKGYTDESALQNATRETLQLPPAVPQPLVDKLLKAFGQSGNPVVASGFRCILLSFTLSTCCASSTIVWKKASTGLTLLSCFDSQPFEVRHRGCIHSTKADCKFCCGSVYFVQHVLLLAFKVQLGLAHQQPTKP